MNRKALIQNLLDNPGQVWDVIVIGGGATGLGISVDAAARGFRTLLLERSDFSKGTSSRSTKLVHGGVRYLAGGDIFLVIEALRERGLMLKNAPHLTSNQEFIIPVYTIWDCILYTAGLKFYDLLAGRLSMGRSYFINRTVIAGRLPLIKKEKLKGGIVYHDGQFDDSRMAISLAVACVKHGGTVLNYFPVSGLIKDDSGKITGVRATDTKSERNFELKGKIVINATGVFADEIHRMDSPDSKPTIRPSQGVHIVLDSSFLQGSSAVMIPKTDDGRVLFVIPWSGKIVAGTTDTPIGSVSEEPRALAEEVDFILKTAGKYLTREPKREDILCIYAGLRPLAADQDNPLSTKEISRRHKISVSKSGLLSIIGGKWTSYRRMAEETIDRGIKTGLLEKRDCVTGNLCFYSNNQFLKNERLKTYGDHAAEIEKFIDEKPDLGEPLDPRFPYTRAEIIWICRNEMPVTIEDVLARRTRALFLNAKASLAIAPEVARLMADESGFDSDWQAHQLEEYGKLVLNYM